MFSRHPYGYLKSQVIRPLIARLLGKSLPYQEGEHHKRQRAMLAPVFMHENVKKMDEDIRRAADKLVDVLGEHIRINQGGLVKVNILEWTCRATLDIIGEHYYSAPRSRFEAHARGVR